jgi:hypothetical protein
MGTALYLLNRYPASFAKTEATELLRQTKIQVVEDRPLKFVVYDLVYAFQRLEARRLGIRQDLYPAHYAEFRHDFIAALAMWVPGVDPLVDGIREAIDANSDGRPDDVAKILRDMLEVSEKETSVRQSKNAASRRRMPTVNEYILEKLRQNPHLTQIELWQHMEADSASLNDPRIGEIEEDRVHIFDVIPKEKSKKLSITRTYSRSSFRSRLSKLKAKYSLSP